MIRLAYSATAQDDLVAFYESAIAEEGETAADKALDHLMNRCEDLARFPDMGRRRPELDAVGHMVRTVTEDGRLLVYTKRGTTLIVARVLKDA